MPRTFVARTAAARWLRRRLQGWRLRHQLPFNFYIHLIGIPMAVAGLVILLAVWPAYWPGIWACRWYWGVGALRTRLSSPVDRPPRGGQRPRRMGRDQAPARHALRRNRAALEPRRPQSPLAPRSSSARRPPRLPARRLLTASFISSLAQASPSSSHSPHSRQKFPLSTDRNSRYRPWHLRLSVVRFHATASDGGSVRRWGQPSHAGRIGRGRIVPTG